MSEVVIRLQGTSECHLTHVPSGATIQTDTPPEYGGQGRAFSSTDLLAGALGSCIATSLATVAQRHGVEVGAIEIRVQKRLSEVPRRIASLAVTIHLPTGTDEAVGQLLLRAAHTCPVHRSLHPEVATTIALA